MVEDTLAIIAVMTEFSMIMIYFIENVAFKFLDKSIKGLICGTNT